jgi:hypothetical protein
MRHSYSNGWRESAKGRSALALVDQIDRKEALHGLEQYTAKRYMVVEATAKGWEEEVNSMGRWLGYTLETEEPKALDSRKA